MKKTSQALKQKNLSAEQLPTEIKSQVEKLTDMTENYNEIVENYEKEEETNKDLEKELDDLHADIQKTDDELSELIKNYNPEPPAQKSAEGTKTEEKKDNGIGWLIFGGIVLVATVGAVNMFKKR